MRRSTGASWRKDHLAKTCILGVIVCCTFSWCVRDADADACAYAHGAPHGDGYAYADGSADEHAHVDVDCNVDAASQRDGNAHTHAHRDGNAHAGRPQPYAERGANLCGLVGQTARWNLCAVLATRDRIDLG